MPSWRFSLTPTSFPAVKAKLELENLPFQLHRLDKLTTGALLLATNDRHVKTFAKQFQDHDIRKSYLAIVRGGSESFRGARTGTIDEWLGVEDGRVRVDEMNGSLALTGWEVLGSSVSFFFASLTTYK